MRGANPHHESNADLYALDLPVELEAQESAVSPKLHSGCFKTTDKLIASLRRTFLCGADTRGNESWRGLQRQTPRNNIPCITTKMLSTAFWMKGHVATVGTNSRRSISVAITWGPGRCC